MTNDANAAAIGERTYGAARGMKDFIMITLGTGVGSGIVINGQMVYGLSLIHIYGVKCLHEGPIGKVRTGIPFS